MPPSPKILTPSNHNTIPRAFALRWLLGGLPADSGFDSLIDSHGRESAEIDKRKDKTMKTKHFERRLESAHNDIVLKADDYMLVVCIEGRDEKGMCTRLIPQRVQELKKMIEQWERFYYNESFQEE